MKILDPLYLISQQLPEILNRLGSINLVALDLPLSYLSVKIQNQKASKCKVEMRVLACKGVVIKIGNQNQISRNLGKYMSTQEGKILRIQLYHPLIGIHNFDVSTRDNISDLRSMLTENTQMTIFQNYRFWANGKLLPELQEIGQVVQNEARINILLDPFDEKTSYYHLERVKDMLASPIEWVMLNSRETYDDKELSEGKRLGGISIDNFLDQQLSSPLYESQAQGDRHITFLEQFHFSIHNPPSMHRRLAGDFYYLLVKTLQGREEHITACAQGFYLNNSTNSCLNTNNSSELYFYNLLDLFKYLSPRFKEQFSNLRRMYRLTELDKSIMSSFRAPPLCEWLKGDAGCFQRKTKYNQWKYYTNRTSNEGIIIKDWNEILQMYSVIVSDTSEETSNKEKNQYKIYEDFATFAKETAVKAVEGLIAPINPNAPMPKRRYKYESVLVWFAEDDPLSYNKRQNGQLTRKTVNLELRNLELVEKHKNFDFYNRYTVLVTYKGYSVVVQPIIAGLPDEKQLDRNYSTYNKGGQKIIEDIARVLKIECRNMLKYNRDDSERAFLHPELCCIRGEDKRDYLVNLHTLSAHDLAFPISRSSGSSVRHELVRIFNQKQNCGKLINTAIESGYSLVTNERINEQHIKLNSIKVFAEEIMVPLCMKSLLRENRKFLADSKTVVKVMHQFGLGSRYLGSLHRRSDALHLKLIVERVVIVKTVKNILKQAMRRTELGDIKQTISRFLNCLFCNEATLNVMDEVILKDQFKDEISTNASRKKKKKHEQQYDLEAYEDNFAIRHNAHNCLKPSQIWEQIKQIAVFRYGVAFKERKICQIPCMQSEFGKSALLRDICINLGICLEKTEYFQKQGLLFKPENIEEIRPIVKKTNFSNKHFLSMVKQGDAYLENKRVQEAIEIYNQAINYATTVFGIMTEQLALLNKKVAQIYFRVGELEAAMLFIHCALKMCQKIYGETHVETLECYNLSSQFHFFARELETAEYYLIKSIHLSTVSYGQEYPELIVCYLNLSSIYEVSGRFMDSITSLSHALRTVLKFYGQRHINTAICYAAMSTAHFEIPDIEKAIFFQQKSIEVLDIILRGDDSRIKEAKKVLEYYHQLQSSKKVKQNIQKQRKKMISSPQLFAGFPLFRFPDINYPKDRQMMHRKMQNFMQMPNKFFN